MTTGTQISELTNRIEWWLTKARFKWTQKHKCSFLDHFDENLYKEVQKYTEVKKLAPNWDHFNFKQWSKVINAKKLLNNHDNK